METWFIHSLIGVVAIGIMMALFKVPVAKGHNKYAYSFLSLLVATLLAGILFKNSVHFNSTVILFASMWGALYALLSMLQMQMLKRLDTNALFPITSLGSHTLVVILGITFFHDKMSPLQGIGVIATFLLVGFYNYNHKHITFRNGLLGGAIGIVLLSALSKFIQKFAAISVELNNFIFWQLFFATIAAFLILIVAERKDLKQGMRFNAGIVMWGALLGVLNFVGTTEITTALSTGPFSLTYTINCFYILITSLVAWRFFGEKLTRQKIIFIFLSIGTIIMIGLG
ncbi:MAG: EamA family transporter [Patescibacteria group bacterium]